MLSTAISPPKTYAEWVSVLDTLKSKTDDENFLRCGQLPHPFAHLEHPAREKCEQIAVNAQHSCKVHTTGILFRLI